jgi:aspartate ammonia-lyase
MPIIADTLLNSIALLANACSILRRHCVEGIEVNHAVCYRNVSNSTATLTALVEFLGYETVQEIALEAAKTGGSIREIIVERELLTDMEFNQLISPEHVTKLGTRMKENK